jgi:hypothetical protein
VDLCELGRRDVASVGCSRTAIISSPTLGATSTIRHTHDQGSHRRPHRDARAAPRGAAIMGCVRRTLPMLGLLLAVTASAQAFASTSGAQLWSALGGAVTCGIAIHPENKPPTQLLCSARHVPPPKTHGVGDPGFVFLGSSGRPALARLSQDSFVGMHASTLRSGSRWRVSAIDVTCTVSASAVRCSNRSAHGFTITRSSYHAF